MSLIGFFYKKPTRTKLEQIAKQIENWFLQNPRKRTCRINLFGITKIRKGHVIEDLFKSCAYDIIT